MSNIGSELRIDSYITTISSATSAPHWINMEGCDKAIFICSIGTAVGNLQSAISLLQNATDSGAGGVLNGSSGTLIGSTGSTRVTNARQALITMTTNATGAEVISVNGTTFTFVTATA